jgi:hypothetical protein
MSPSINQLNWSRKESKFCRTGTQFFSVVAQFLLKITCIIFYANVINSVVYPIAQNVANTLLLKLRTKTVKYPYERRGFIFAKILLISNGISGSLSGKVQVVKDNITKKFAIFPKKFTFLHYHFSEIFTIFPKNFNILKLSFF